MELRDNLLKSTPLGWAWRWGRIERVKLLARASDLWNQMRSHGEPKPWAETM